jgi:protoheme IX farnesyltransferase
VVIYTWWLKRRSPENIVIGGGAGAFPPLVGWAAATGSLSLMAFFLFAIIFFWTPPHFWSLALILQKEYTVAGVPMYPVVYGERATRLQIFLYSFPLVGLTLLPYAFDLTGPYFMGVAVMLGSLFIYSAWQLRRRSNLKNAWWLYRYSLIYLALLFVALLVDRWFS